MQTTLWGSCWLFSKGWCSKWLVNTSLMTIDIHTAFLISVRLHLCDRWHQWRGHWVAFSRGIWPHFTPLECPTCHGDPKGLCGCRKPQQLHLCGRRLERGLGLPRDGGEVLPWGGLCSLILYVYKIIYIHIYMKIVLNQNCCQCLMH